MGKIHVFALLGPPVDEAELLTSQSHRGSVDHWHQFINVVDQYSIEQMLVPVLKKEEKVMRGLCMCIIMAMKAGSSQMKEQFENFKGETHVIHLDQTSKGFSS